MSSDTNLALLPPFHLKPLENLLAAKREGAQEPQPLPRQHELPFRPRMKSVRVRLRRLVILSVGLALLCLAILNTWQEATSFLTEKQESLLATASVIAGASSAAVASGDISAVRQSFRSVSRLPYLSYAKIEDRNGKTLVEAGSTVRLKGDLSLDEPGAGAVFRLLRTRTVQVAVPITYGGESIGRLLFVSDVSGLGRRFQQVLVVALLSSLLAISGALIVAHRLQRSITDPLAALAADMARIARSHDYSASVPATHDLETELLAESFRSMMGEIRKASLAVHRTEAELIFRLSRATEKRDNETGAHILRMAQVCRIIGKGLRLDERTLDALHRAAPLHDVGKIGVPDSIIFKPGRLDPDERREMEQHAGYGYEILRDSKSDLIRLAAEIAWSHHERWDGKGYPRGLKGEEIPLSGRVAAVADVCDALASERPYKPAWSLEAVRAHLVENSGTQFDPACVESLLRHWDEACQIYTQRDSGAAA